MRVVFLNSWYAKAGNPFYDFIFQNSPETDIFCLSEVHPELFSKLKTILTGFSGVYGKGIFDKNMNFRYGQAVFTKSVKVKTLSRLKSPTDFENEPDFAFAMAFGMKSNAGLFNLVNLHGKSRPGDKLDTPARIKQSEMIIDFLKSKPGPKIIGGDFNLLPDTESIKMFERAGYRNLIKDFDIKETRNKLSWQQFPDKEKQHFADYCFVSPGVEVVNFKVPKNEISDHLPLILDFEI